MIERPTSGPSSPNPGIASLTPVADESFLSGGHDKLVYYWNVRATDRRRRDREAFSVTSLRVPTNHKQAVRALAYSRWDETIYSAAGDSIAMTKLNALASVGTERVSSRVNQVHVHPQNPRLIVLEVGRWPRLPRGPPPALSSMFRPPPSRAEATMLN